MHLSLPILFTTLAAVSASPLQSESATPITCPEDTKGFCCKEQGRFDHRKYDPANCQLADRYFGSDFNFTDTETLWMPCGKGTFSSCLWNDLDLPPADSAHPISSSSSTLTRTPTTTWTQVSSSIETTLTSVTRTNSDATPLASPTSTAQASALDETSLVMTNYLKTSTETSTESSTTTLCASSTPSKPIKILENHEVLFIQISP